MRLNRLWRRGVWFVLVYICLFLLAVPALRGYADTPYAFYSQSFSGSGNLPVIRLQGASSCVYTLAGVGSGNAGTVTPKGSSDNGATTQTITNTGFGAQTANGYYGGAMIPSSGSPYSTNFYVAVTSVVGTVTVTETCSSQIAQGGGSGGSSTVTCASPGCTVIQGTTPWTVNTPAPAPTNGTDSGINVHVANQPTANASFPPNTVPQMMYGAAGTQIPGLSVGCNNYFTWSTTGPGTLTAQNLTAGSSIYVCGWVFSSTAGTTSVAKATSNACTSSTTLYASIAGVSSNDSSAYWRGLGGPQPLLGDALCIVLGAGTTGATGTIYFSVASPGP